MACPAATSCATAGFCNDSANNQQGLPLAGPGTTWTATQAPPPGDATATPDVSLRSVACTSGSSSATIGHHDAGPPG